MNPDPIKAITNKSDNCHLLTWDTKLLEEVRGGLAQYHDNVTGTSGVFSLRDNTNYLQ